MYQLILSSAFDRQLKKFLKANPKNKARVIKTLKLARVNIKHPSLRLHKLEGTSNYSLSVTKNIRLITHIEKDCLFLLRIAYHDQAYR
ncbi:MAG: plasmid stabilization protein [Candidatus Chisholmbacteria bacterium]|nr:plasmid stabilization protein [Candidatus Chisholmbacteria bacterium]